MAKYKLWQKGFTWLIPPSSQSQTERSQSRGSKQKALRNSSCLVVLFWLTWGSCSFPTWFGMVPPTIGWTLPTSIVNWGFPSQGPVRGLVHVLENEPLAFASNYVLMFHLYVWGGVSSCSQDSVQILHLVHCLGSQTPYEVARNSGPRNSFNLMSGTVVVCVCLVCLTFGLLVSICKA